MIIPAIDLINGTVVRLYQGDYQQKTEYPLTAEQLVALYHQQGAKRLHLVDLDGAKDSQQRQTKRLAQIINSAAMPVQVGGGVRCQADVDTLLELGARSVVVGSLAIKQPELVASWLKEYGKQAIVLALDVNIDQHGHKHLPTHGWIERSEHTLEQLIDGYGADNIGHILCTDIAKDGTLQGCNTELYRQMKRAYPAIQWQASGGIGSLEDVKRAAISGADSLILGRALLENKFTVKEAISCWQNA
ncbi:1-(5-phosphoribosyl)-5-[(5-phosphoribosylamino)methylideneamino]imidazole-4-carboxamide isomerase [Thalassotalea ponticola]|uniref:1-(5-phosphoribosyl)-5-[(5- phosphoribosylamino)methylideneamino]imidazole-4- carboxamide isomerase n=1 Tax=Thalassotalea ponticola TaxID=1523392 RepID=UPI0025B49DD8|nr:1-(5-phosphoribosyl)-5-[(5-phosphoribosylamino)methylideneamino]imidazole-4-carboxamide isomerase [Thalassotalea ponticola]MDN3651304.1 1-(5-phosphoribosyl)-5-[(5-phosphoribosylamino)methylideneamino]imidazole-4-carboxamide isomerase [Thalassotalea ponticola]